MLSNGVADGFIVAVSEETQMLEDLVTSTMLL